MYDDFFAKAHELTQQGVSFVTATVVRAEKPTSGKPGDKAIITADGVMYGWIGGSCAQPTVIKESLKALADEESCLIRLSPEPELESPREGVLDLPMVCFSGGTLEIYLEPQHPRPRLLIVGNLPIAHALAHLGAAMNYHVIGVDLDGNGEGWPHADQLIYNLEDAVKEVKPSTYVVVATHGNYDEMALEKILPARPTYVGLVASPKRAEAVREYLSGQGVGEEAMALLKAPAGLDIHARRGDEIALSIMAEIVERRRSSVMPKSEHDHPHHEHHHEEEASGGIDISHHLMMSPMPSAKGETAVDPICKMEVEIATAKYTSDYRGTTYYFCCPGCKMTFEKDPEKALALA
ncbi:MAG: XdhC family protein [Candidatus Promineifilaceae bacterium]